MKKFIVLLLFNRPFSIMAICIWIRFFDGQKLLIRKRTKIFQTTRIFNPWVKSIKKILQSLSSLIIMKNTCLNFYSHKWEENAKINWGIANLIEWLFHWYDLQNLSNCVWNLKIGAIIAKKFPKISNGEIRMKINTIMILSSKLTYSESKIHEGFRSSKQKPWSI